MIGAVDNHSIVGAATEKTRVAGRGRDRLELEATTKPALQMVFCVGVVTAHPHGQVLALCIVQ